MKIFMIGDSTMANYDKVKEYPRRGWGQELGKYFDERNVQVINNALPGWTTKLFIDTKRIAEVLDLLEQGDYLIMQFGHNDQKSNDKDYVPLENYKENLKYFVNEALLRGATPVICSSISRRLYNESGSLIKAGDAGLFEHSLKEYAEAAQSVANELGVLFVDLFSYSQKVLSTTSKEQARTFYMDLYAKDSYWLEKNPDYVSSDYFLTGKNPNDPYSYNPDNTHLSIEGADKWASYFADCLKASYTELLCETDKIEIHEFNGDGYMPVISSCGWRVAVVNACEKLLEENIKSMERHLTSDEVFVLTKGNATLFIGEERKRIDMELGKIYNVKCGLWHSLATKPDSSLLIVENDNVSSENTERICLDKGWQ